MYHTKLFIAFALLFVAIANASVLKPGRKAAITAEQINTPYGRSYLRKHIDNIIFPGTKWCGDGDDATDYDDLGKFVETDKCCRDHDYCDDLIEAGESNHGLVNNGLFTRLHCKCDLTFFKCLGETNCNTSSGIVGTVYFNALGGQCFDYKHPATCVEWHSIIGVRERCVKYDYDMTKPEEWQWFDVPRWIELKNQCIN